MYELNHEYLLDFELRIDPALQIGAVPTGNRLVAVATGGSFSGPRLTGDVLAGGGDWMVVGNDGTMVIDVRTILKTDDGHLITMNYGGRISIPLDLMAQVFDPDQVESVDPSRYYFRATPTFEAAIGSPYSWLNSVVAVAVGRIAKGAVRYRIYAIT